MASLTEFKTDEKSWWCPGCGDFGVLAGLQKAVSNLGREPEDVAIVSGIGCSGKIGNYIHSYNLHVTHGRALPAAVGIKLANRNLTVIAAGGDGDGFAIGMSHFVHAVRRNVDITYVVMDNQVYGLTKGQTSPCSETGFKTKSTPRGNIERPVQPLLLALSAGATFVAQGFSSNTKQLVRLIEEAINHRGFSLVNVYSPCVTYNKVNTYDWFKETLYDLDQETDYDPTDRHAAIRKVAEHNELLTGLVYKEDTPSYNELLPGYRAEPLVQQDWTMPAAQWQQILAGYR